MYCTDRSGIVLGEGGWWPGAPGGSASPRSLADFFLLFCRRHESGEGHLLQAGRQGGRGAAGQRAAEFGRGRARKVADGGWRPPLNGQYNVRDGKQAAEHLCLGARVTKNSNQGSLAR